MTSRHPYIADLFFVGGGVLFLAKFLSWELSREHAQKKRVQGIAGLLTLLLLIGALYGNHNYMNRPTNDVISRPQMANSQSYASLNQVRELLERVTAVIEENIGTHMTPDISKAKSSTYINSINQFEANDRLSDVSTIVPGYFELYSPPIPTALYGFSDAITKKPFSTHYYASVRMAPVQNVQTLELIGRGVCFAVDATWTKFFIYESEENWTNWRFIKVEKEQPINTLSIDQRGRIVRAFINNKYVGSLTLLRKPPKGPIGIRLKGNALLGGRLHFQKLSLWEF
jgi:hypothetical protein